MNSEFRTGADHERHLMESRPVPLNYNRQIWEGGDPLYQAELTPFQKALSDKIRETREGNYPPEILEEKVFEIQTIAYANSQARIDELNAEHFADKEKYEKGIDRPRLADDMRRERMIYDMYMKTELKRIWDSVVHDEIELPPHKIEALAMAVSARCDDREEVNGYPGKEEIRNYLQTSNYNEPFRKEHPERYAEIAFLQSEFGIINVLSPTGIVGIEISKLFI